MPQNIFIMHEPDAQKELRINGILCTYNGFFFIDSDGCREKSFNTNIFRPAVAIHLASELPDLSEVLDLSSFAKHICSKARNLGPPGTRTFAGASTVTFRKVLGTWIFQFIGAGERDWFGQYPNLYKAIKAIKTSQYNEEKLDRDLFDQLVSA